MNRQLPELSLKPRVNVHVLNLYCNFTDGTHHHADSECSVFIFKDKSFTSGVNREIVKSGFEMLEMDLDTVMQQTINGMKEKAAVIGLKGTL